MRSFKAFLLAALALFPGGCATSVQYILVADGGDRGSSWSHHIQDWQARHRIRTEEYAAHAEEGRNPLLAGSVLTPAPPEENLAVWYLNYRRQERLSLVSSLTTWLQNAAARRYRKEPDDYWPTLDEVLRENGDDCDGLDLLAFHFLRDFGFNRVYRAVLGEPQRGVFHSVTLWFEEAHDPWVVDATGAAAKGLKKLSKLRGWRVEAVFDDEKEHTLQSRRRSLARILR